MIKLDRITIQKPIKNLVDKELVKKTQRNISEGIYFLYLIENKKEIKDKIKEIIHKWCKGVENTVNKIYFSFPVKKLFIC